MQCVITSNDTAINNLFKTLLHTNLSYIYLSSSSRVVFDIIKCNPWQISYHFQRTLYTRASHGRRHLTFNYPTCIASKSKLAPSISASLPTRPRDPAAGWRSEHVHFLSSVNPAKEGLFLSRLKKWKSIQKNIRTIFENGNFGQIKNRGLTWACEYYRTAAAQVC